MTEKVSGLFLREIQLGDVLGKFSAGKEQFAPLKMFLIKDAWKFHEENIAKTFVLTDAKEAPGRVYAYITITCSAIELEEEQRPAEPARASKYPTYPAVKIARLAVDSAMRRCGLGGQLIAWAIAHVKDKIMPHAGCRFLIVDSKQESISFYEKFGFMLVDSEDNKQANNPMMFIDLHLLK